MKRRSYLTAMFTATLAAIAGAKARAQSAPKSPIVLNCDLSVDASREPELLKNFHTVFKPAAEKFPGYIDVKLLKLRTVYTGAAPAGVNYRFQLTYESEELRQKWIKSDVHQKVWPTVENTLSTKNYSTLLFDSK
jgi:heme-degrading monooxygenase HmoA